MSLDALLIHSCVIQNPVGDVTDRYGNSVAEYGAGEPTICRLIEEQERVWVDEFSQSVVATTYKLVIPAGILVRERARIAEIVLEDGVEVDGEFFVRAVLRRDGRSGWHHQILLLERVA